MARKARHARVCPSLYRRLGPFGPEPVFRHAAANLSKLGELLILVPKVGLNQPPCPFILLTRDPLALCGQSRCHFRLKRLTFFGDLCQLIAYSCVFLGETLFVPLTRRLD
jgi:hypothetical protein